MFRKRDGTSGIRGQLYETKLISLIYFRAKHDDNIEKFHLGTNIDLVGAFDDICFRAKLKGLERPLVVFVQAKHRGNDKVAFNNKNDLTKYFDSYLNIKQAFKPNNKDAFFDGTFDDIECFFAMYTTATDDFENVPVESSYASYLYSYIGTGGSAKQPYKNAENVKFLCKIAMKEQITSLAALIVKFTYDEGNFQIMLNDDLILRYHVILAQRVLHVSDIQPEGYRIATFRQDFFNTNEEFLILFKDTLYAEVLKKRKLEDSERQNLLTDLLRDPSDVTVLSKLIGTVITYNNGQLELIDKTKSETLKRQLKDVYVPQLAVSEAVELAAKGMLSSKSFKVPTSFGNKDLTIRGNDDKVEKRLNYLSSRIIDLLDNSKSNHIVTLDDSLGSGFLQLNGGIGGAVGNLLVLDEDAILMKFADNRDLLGDLAGRLYDKLLHAMPNLHEYKFKLKVVKFPKLSLDYGEHEESLAADFLKKLLYYTNQADENVVEEILKSEIGNDQSNYVNNFQVKTDAIFLKFHDEIQKWWMKPKEAPYLTKKSKIFENSVNNIVKEPLMSIIHLMYMNKVKHISYTFSELAVNSLKLQDQQSAAVIVTESSALTVAKVIQYLKNKDYAVLDMEYIMNLPMNDRNALRTELTNMSEKETLVLVCDKIQNSVIVDKTLQNIAKAIDKKRAVVVTNSSSIELIKKYFLQINNVVHDERNNLIDMSEESQNSILETARVIFQGKEVSLSVVVDDESKAYVKGDVLNGIINKETMVFGKPFLKYKNDEMEFPFITRRVKKSINDEDIVLESLHDISEDVVLVTAKPGMGKSTLLTHLSHKTKEIDPRMWISRINLVEYSSKFSKWEENKTVIDLLETLTFMCQIILREKLGKDNKVEIALEEANGAVCLRECTGDQWTVLELKLFLHYYNRKTLIFLFDGFDEICPDYMHEVMACFKIVQNNNRKHRMWITSRSYNDIKTILQQEFGTSYEMQCFSSAERAKYLERFWKTNVKLNDFNSDQLDNVREFFKFMSDKKESSYKRKSLIFDIYIYGGDFLRNEIKYTYIPLWKYDKNIDEACKHIHFKAILLNHRIYMGSIYGDNTDGTPINLYLLAEYFVTKLMEVDKSADKWDLDVNTFTIYERYLEKKLKTIRFVEKHGMDMDNPDIRTVYNKERTDFVSRHKELAAYGIFHRHKHTLFDKKQLKRVDDTIRFIEKGGEKTGLIHSIENHIPIFVHMTFAEYFAVDYLCDLLKNEDTDEVQQKSLFLLITNGVFLNFTGNIRKILNYKMRVDNDFMQVLYSNRSVIYNCIMEPGEVHLDVSGTGPALVGVDERPRGAEARRRAVLAFHLSLNTSTMEGLDSYMNLFVAMLGTVLDARSFNDFLTIIKETRLLTTALYRQYYILLKFVIEMVRKLDMDMGDVLCGQFPFLSRSTGYGGMTTEQILEHVSQKCRMSRSPANGASRKVEQQPN